jgi:hypothetical protein
MPVLFGLDIQALVAQSLAAAGNVYDSTLTRISAGTPNPVDPTGPPSQVVTAYPCKGVADEIVSELVQDDGVRRVTGKVTIILGTLPVGVSPQPGDQITTVDPRTGGIVTGTVAGAPGTGERGKRVVVVDPAGATAVCAIQV